MNDGELLAKMGTDAQIWASEWVAKAALILARTNNDSLALLDEGWMIGWFANAIEAGRMAGRDEK